MSRPSLPHSTSNSAEVLLFFTVISSVIGTFGKPSLTAHIAGLPESFRQGGGGVELTRASYQAEEAKQG